jgi:beta-glucanase (GH16 family)
VRNGWGPMEKDRSNGEAAAGDGRVLTLQGQRFTKGLGVHAASEVQYKVPSGCTRFDSVIGLDDEVGSHGAVVFQVFKGSTKSFDSGLRTGSSANRTVSTSVVPGTTLRLVVTDGGNGVGMDHADWANARLTCTAPAPTAPAPTAPAPAAPGGPLYVSALTPVLSLNGWGPVEKDRSNGEQGAGDGRSLTLQGQVFARGLGVHAHSEVRYTVPATCTRFDSVVGVDDYVGASGSVVFQVFHGANKVYDSGLRTGSSPNVAVSIPVTGGSQLGLVVADGGDGVGMDHADWADARFTCADTTVPAPSSQPVSSGPDGPVSSDPSKPLGATGTWSALFTDEFTGTSLDAAKWSDSDAWQRSGWAQDSAWFPVPHTREQIEVANGAVTLKSRRGTNLPQGKAFTSGHINTWNKFTLPAGATTYTEARIKASSAKGMLPGFWLLGTGTNTTGNGWPITGEIDILEFANNANETGSPYFSVWYPKDVWTNAPGTFLNGTHDTHPNSWAKRTELLNSWHTWGLYRSPQKMELFIDGKPIATFLPNVAYHNGIKLPPMLFSNEQHIRLSMLVGGAWAGAGYTESQYENGDLSVDYVRVWRQ